MQRSSKLLLFLCLFAIIGSCKKTDSQQQLLFTFKFDKTQQRLNNLGQPATMPAGNAALTPDFQEMSVHYIELAPTAFTQLGAGAIVYKGAETTQGGAQAIDFAQSPHKGEGQPFYTISLKDVAPGTYEWVRASVAYQKYEVAFDLHNTLAGDLLAQKGTIASFVGYNTYIGNLLVKNKSITVNDDKRQGFWVFETSFSAPFDTYNSIISGDAPAGATTVVNPLAATSPVPPGSCVVTGRFATPLVITGNEHEDINITLSFSVNNSFEWKDTNANGKWDIYADQSQPTEQIMDMGLRGLVPSY